MVYTEETKKAARIAYDAHHGQFDKGGMPYFMHPVHLAEQMPDEATTVVALLHDVIEDSDVTLDDIRDYGFTQDIIDALDIITRKHDDVSYFEYIRLVKTNEIAKLVKLADLRHNLDQTRLQNLSPKNTRLAKRYMKAMEILEDESE